MYRQLTNDMIKKCQFQPSIVKIAVNQIDINEFIEIEAMEVPTGTLIRLLTYMKDPVSKTTDLVDVHQEVIDGIKIGINEENQLFLYNEFSLTFEEKIRVKINTTDEEIDINGETNETQPDAGSNEKESEGTEDEENGENNGETESPEVVFGESEQSVDEQHDQVDDSSQSSINSDAESETEDRKEEQSSDKRTEVDQSYKRFTFNTEEKPDKSNNRYSSDFVNKPNKHFIGVKQQEKRERVERPPQVTVIGKKEQATDAIRRDLRRRNYDPEFFKSIVEDAYSIK